MSSKNTSPLLSVRPRFGACIQPPSSKALKQLCEIKTFVGTSANAVKTQVWTALIAMLLLRFLQLRARFGWALSNLLALLRQQLFVHRDLWTWLDDPFQPPPPPPEEQLQLALA